MWHQSTPDLTHFYLKFKWFGSFYLLRTILYVERLIIWIDVSVGVTVYYYVSDVSTDSINRTQLL